MIKHKGNWPIWFLAVARAVTVGLAYWAVISIPGLSSTFIAIFTALLPFDLIVAMPRFSWRPDHWKELYTVIKPRVAGTAVTLGQGLFLGLLFGGLTKLGLPVFLGAVLTIGLAYELALRNKGNISSYVSMIAGIALFDRIVRLQDLIDADLLTDTITIAFQMAYGTFVALAVGWIVGVVAGIVVRLFLPRGYRSKRSNAYDLPLHMQPVQDVMHLAQNQIIFRVEVGPGSPWIGQTLGQIGLRTKMQASILSIFRRTADVVAPTGSDIIECGDTLVILAPIERSEEIAQIAKGSGMVGKV